MPPTVTSWFIRGILRGGRLTEARRRFENGSARPSDWRLESSSCWGLVCEEVIDTDHDPADYDAIYAELIRRGFSAAEIDAMRRLAWETAGWLNYDAMLWDWCHLDERDMRTALDEKLSRRRIWKRSHRRSLETIQNYLDRDPPRSVSPINPAASSPPESP